MRRSTVDLRSCSLSGLLAGKLFCGQTEEESEPQDMRSHPSLSSVCLCLWARSSTATQFPLQISNTCYCVGVQCILDVSVHVSEGAVTLTNASACFCLYRFWQRERWGEIKRREAVATEEVGWCSSMQFVYPVVVIYHKLFKVYMSDNSELKSSLTLYMDRSILRELWSWSRSLTKRSFCGDKVTDY